MDTQKVEFDAPDGHRLVGRLHRPLGPPRAYALFAHCFTCSKDIKAAVRISRALVDRGIATLRFDFTGLGESTGDFAESTFSSNVGELLRAAAFLEEHHRAPDLLIGHSLGGAAVLAAASRVPSCAAVATIGAPYDPAHVKHVIPAAEIVARGEAEVKLAGRTFRMKKEFLDDLAAQDNESRIRDLGRPLLIMHAPGDTIVGIDDAGLIYQAARHPKSFVSLDGADHLLNEEADASYVADVLAAWVSRYLPDASPASDGPRELLVQTGREAFRNRMTTGPHTLIADEPTSIPGGTDYGPAPYDYLLAALGSCTSMTLRMYADRKKWPLQGVKIVLRHEKVHAKDCEECETRIGKLDDIQKEITLEGNLSEEQRERLMQIADMCPVHRSLHGEVRITSRRVDHDRQT